MPKRRNQKTGERSFDVDDNPIDLTGAFAPVKGPQSVDYDNEDEQIGLTSAFGAITPEELSERDWDDDNKWKGFNWTESITGDYESDAVEEDDSAALSSDGSAHADDTGEHFMSDEKRGAHSKLTEREARKAEKEEAEENIESDGFTEEDFLDDEDLELAEQEETEEKEVRKAKAKRTKHGAHAAPEPELSPRMKKSKRTRRVLIVLVILFVIVIVALGYFTFRAISNSQQEAAQQTLDKNSNSSANTAIDQTSDAIDSMTRLADVPNLAQLLGMTQDEALTAIGHGALVTSNREVNEDGNPIKTTLNVALTDEAADSRTGTPTVYLGLAQNGRVCQAGYSASAAALGFSSLSFADAVNTEHVIEKTLAKTGVDIPEGSALLPADKAAYTTYANDGTTVVRERCSFDGDVTVNGIPCAWSAVLSYDYTTQIVTGNLSDTVRIIYVYLTEK